MGKKNFKRKNTIPQKASSRNFEDDQFILKEFMSSSKCKTAIENELEMQAQRILYIFDKAIFKIKIVSCLNHFVRCNGKLLKEYLKPEDVQYILKVYDKYDETKNLKRVSVIEDKSETSLSTESSSNDDYLDVLKDIREKFASGIIGEKRSSEFDIDVTQAIDLIFFCEPLRYSIDKYSKFMDPKAKMLIEMFSSLRDAAHRYLIMTAEQEYAYEANLKAAYNENKDTVLEIQKLKGILKKQRHELCLQIKERNDQIEKCMNEIESLREGVINNIKQIVKKSERQMNQNAIASEAKQAILASQAAESKERYKSLLENHLMDEKILRVKEDKIEVQLSQWLAKYDTDMGDRQVIKEKLTAEYDADTEELNRINDLIMDQESLFEALMAEKEREEYEINMGIAEEYRRNRAAKIIQTAWKDYKFRKWMRKMARKAKRERKLKSSEVKTETPVEIDTTGLFDDLPVGASVDLE